MFLWLLVSCGYEERKVRKDKPSKIWRGVLVLSGDKLTKLPFIFEYDPLDSTTKKLTIINAEERIELNDVTQIGDSLFIKMDPYDSELRVALEKKEMKGVWVNYAKGKDYQLPFYARNGNKMRFFEHKFEEFDLNGKFEVWFGDTVTGYPALAELKQEGRKLTGTFRTETGDYRYLEGVQSGDKVFLSCFDGAHAFLFTSEVKIDSTLDNRLTLFNGNFYSGSHYQETWSGFLSDTFNLKSPDSLTIIKDDTSTFSFELGMSSGDTLSLNHPNFENKVSLIQILGTWCPNCKDETEYLKKIYEKWGNDKVYVLGVAFEMGADAEKSQERLSTYKSQMEIPYDLVYGGEADKKRVIEVFPALNKLISYPTLIVLDKNQDVVKIHTGFNGPATSQYSSFVEEMDILIDSLVVN